MNADKTGVDNDNARRVAAGSKGSARWRRSSRGGGRFPRPAEGVQVQRVFLARPFGLVDDLQLSIIQQCGLEIPPCSGEQEVNGKDMAGFVIVKADMLVGLFGLGEDSFQLLKAG